jgi:hypothetical protein
MQIAGGDLLHCPSVREHVHVALVDVDAERLLDAEREIEQIHPHRSHLLEPV